MERSLLLFNKFQVIEHNKNILVDVQISSKPFRWAKKGGIPPLFLILDWLLLRL